MRCHGPGSPGGVAHAYKVLEHTVDLALARPDRGRAAERCVFVLSHRYCDVTLSVRDGFVTDEFIDLARTEQRTPEQEMRLTGLKAAMAERVVAAPADAVSRRVTLRDPRASLYRSTRRAISCRQPKIMP